VGWTWPPSQIAARHQFEVCQTPAHKAGKWNALEPRFQTASIAAIVIATPNARILNRTDIIASRIQNKIVKLVCS
jgi:hypothetical protein